MTAINMIKGMVVGTLDELRGKDDYATPPYETVKSDKELPFEERVYEGGRKWACTKATTGILEENDGMFWKLFKYITGENESRTPIAMTVPVKILYKPIADGKVEKQMCFYLDDRFQENPPAPTNPDVTIETHPELRVYTRIRAERMTPTTWQQERKDLEALLKEHRCNIETDRYYLTGYQGRSKMFNLRSEVWFAKKQD